MKRVRKLLVAAAGKGTRFLPITSTLPKEMFPIIDKPMFQYVLEEGIVDGINELVLVINENKGLLLDYIKKSKDKKFQELIGSVKLTIVDQKGSLYGDAIPIYEARKHLGDEPFMVLWADSFGLRKHGRIKRMLKIFSQKEKPLISLISKNRRASYLYAIPKIKPVSKNLVMVKRLFEKPGSRAIPSRFTFPNGLLLEPDIFPYIEKTKPNRRGEISIVDTIDSYCQKNLVYGSIFQKPFFEAGNPVDLVETMSRLIKLRKT